MEEGVTMTVVLVVCVDHLSCFYLFLQNGLEALGGNIQDLGENINGHQQTLEVWW